MFTIYKNGGYKQGVRMKKTLLKTIIMGLFSAAMLFTACKPVAGVETKGNEDETDPSIIYDEGPVYVEATERGIEFYYTSVTKKGNVLITELESGIKLSTNITEESYGYRWNYPFVEKGKKYKFHFQVMSDNFSIKATAITDAYITVTAKGGLGEYKVENADKVKTCFSNDSKIISRSEVPVFTENSKVLVQREWVHYEIWREKEDIEGLEEDCWILEPDVWDPLEENTLDIHDSFLISGWKSFEQIDATLSGHKYKITTQTVLSLNNTISCDYWNSPRISFYMNDKSTLTGDWGGKAAKVAVIYGVDGKYTSEDLSDITGLPGSPVTMEYGGETITYPYVSINENYGSYYLPEYAVKYKGKQCYFAQKTQGKFWPGNYGDMVCTINGEEYYIYFMSLGDFYI